jgi:hypothetical protein
MRSTIIGELAFRAVLTSFEVSRTSNVMSSTTEVPAGPKMLTLAANQRASMSNMLTSNAKMRPCTASGVLGL